MTIRIRQRDKTSIQMQQAGYLAGYERYNSCFAGVSYGTGSSIWGGIRINLNTVMRERKFMKLSRLAVILALKFAASACSSGSGDSSGATAEILAVAQHLSGNKLGIKVEDLRSLPNPRGQGTFVYCPTTRFSGVERKVLWLVLNGQAFPLNGATKGSVTPSLPWPREVPEEEWGATGLDPYFPSEALKIVFGE